MIKGGSVLLLLSMFFAYLLAPAVDMVSRMLAVEAEFDLMIPTADITPQNFRSIAAIDALVSRLGNAAVPSA